MTDDELQRCLSKLTVPAPDDSAGETAWQRARLAYLHRAAADGSRQSAAPGFYRRWGWAAAWLTAAAACALAVLFFLPRGGSHALDPKVLGEMEKLFPGQLDAVIARGDQISLELSEQAAGSRAQPLEVILRRGRESIHVLAYSGSKVCVRLNGQRRCFETLLTADQRVILCGDDFLWQPDQRQTLAGYQIQARPNLAL